jgi:hypothetical protein
VPEPGEPQSLNRFSYVNNNPLRYTDPTGHYLLLEDAAGELSAFALHRTTHTGYRILRGGSHFRNYYERAYGNYYLSGMRTRLPPNPGGAFGSSVIGSATNAFREVEGSVSSELNGLLADPALIAGAGTASTKLLGIVAGEVTPLAAAGIATVGRRVPNPGGRLGGPEHQAAVRRTAADIEARGFELKTEFRVKTPGGHKPERYVDIAALDPVSGLPVEFHQVGALKVTGSPIAREARALDDIRDHGQYQGVPLSFHKK